MGGAAPPPAFAYQAEGTAWLIERACDGGTAALFDEPGLGKSRQLLEAAIEPVLVVAPAMVLDGGTWDDQVDLWAPGMDVTQVGWSSLNERVRTDKGGNKPTDRLRPELRRRWGTVILDESHYMKGRKTHWTKAALKLDAERLYLATGTPIPNWAHEAFTTLQALYPTETQGGGRFGSYWRWVAEWFRVGPGVFSPMEVKDPLDDTDAGWARFYEATFGDRMLLRQRDEVQAQLPPLTHVWHRLSLKGEQARVYKALKRDYVAWAGGQEVSAWSSGGLHTKLARVCTALELVADGVKPSSAKLDLFGELVRDQAHPSLAVAHFRDTAVLAAVRASEVGKRAGILHGGTPKAERRAVVRAFQGGDLDVLCATLGVVAEGLNLTQADTVHALERSYRPTLNQQAYRRVHRIGQTRPVTVHQYVGLDTVDEHMLPVLRAKRDQQVKALRARQYADLL